MIDDTYEADLTLLFQSFSDRLSKGGNYLEIDIWHSTTDYGRGGTIDPQFFDTDSILFDMHKSFFKIQILPHVICN